MSYVMLIDGVVRRYLTAIVDSAGLTLLGALCQQEMEALLTPSLPFPPPLHSSSLPLEAGPLKTARGSGGAL